MGKLYNTAAPKKAANLSVNSDLLNKTRALNINLSATLERALQEELAKRAAEQWVEENRSAIESLQRIRRAAWLFRRRISGVLMAQSDVYPDPSRTSKAYYPYLVDVQSPLLRELATRIVIPLG